MLFADESQSHREARELRWEADALERLLVISRCFAERREQLHRNLAAHAIRESRSDIYLCAKSGNPARSSRPDRSEETMRVEARDLRRFRSHGFSQVQRVSAQPGFLGNRLRIVSAWLYASRTDPDVGSALVKTAVAAESLIAGVRAPGRITLQIKERLSALVCPPGQNRDHLSDVLGDHYNLRSDFAHGRQLDPASQSHRANLESFDRLVALGVASLASFSPAVASLSEIDARFDAGVPDAERPFPDNAIRRALEFIQ